MWRPSILTASASGLSRCPPALGASDRRHVAFDLAAHPLRIGLRVAARQVGDDALVPRVVGAGAAALGAVDDGERLLEAVEERIDGRFGQAGDRGVGVEAERVGGRLQQPLVPSARRGPARPRLNCTLRQRALAVRNDEFRIDLHADAQTGAGGASAVGTVEGEVARLDLAEGDEVVGAGEFLGEDAVALLTLHRDQHDAPAEPERLFDAVGQAPAERVSLVIPGGRDDHAVDHDVDRVALGLGERDGIVQGAHLAVHADAHKAGLAGVAEGLGVLALAVLDHGREHHQPGLGGEGQDAVHHLLDRLAADGLAADRAMGAPGAGEEEPQVVIHLGDRADRRAGIAAAALLVDRDSGGEALDVVDVGLLHLAQELPSVRGERLHIAALPLRVDGVEGERGLAGSRDARDDDELVARDGDVDVLEVVLTGAADNDAVQGHRAHLLASAAGSSAGVGSFYARALRGCTARAGPAVRGPVCRGGRGRERILGP